MTTKNISMITGKKGIELIKEYEGLRLTAYKALESEKYYTIGYGHYGKDVKRGMTITEQQAEVMLRNDLQVLERGITEGYKGFALSQHQFDALVSHAYNCGLNSVLGDLRKMIINCEEKEKIRIWWRTHYITSGGVFMKGLARRREAEATLFFRDTIYGKI